MSNWKLGRLALKIFIFLLSFSFLSGTLPLLAANETTLESAHFVIHFENETQPEVRQEVVDFYEQVANTLEERFNGSLKGKIDLHLGDYDRSFASPTDRMAFQYYDPLRPFFRFSCHEVLHIMLGDLLGPGPTEIFEYYLGELATMAFDLYFIQPPFPLHLYASALAEGDLSQMISQIPLKKYQAILPLVSFINFLLEHYPWDCFSSLWQYRSDPALSPLENTFKALKESYGKDVTALEKEWRDYLNSIQVSPEWKETIRLSLEITENFNNAKAEWSEGMEGYSGVVINFKDLPALASTMSEIRDLLNMGPYGISFEPVKDQAKLLKVSDKFQELSKLAAETIKLAYLAQEEVKLQKFEASYSNFQKLRENLIRFGNTSYLPWVNNQLAELETKVPHELVRKYKNESFPWWGWALIGCGVAGVLGLGGWLFLRKRRAGQKENGQQP